MFASLHDFAPASLLTLAVAQHAIDPAFATLDIEPAALRAVLVDFVHRDF